VSLTGHYGCSGDVVDLRHGKQPGDCKVTDIREAREWRDRTGEIADWVVANVPWTIAVPEWPGFNDRWPLLSLTDLAAVEAELLRRGEALDAGDADFDAIVGTLTGRPSVWSAAADWLTSNPEADIKDAEFFRLFGEMSRAELILAAIEHKQRLLRGS